MRVSVQYKKVLLRSFMIVRLVILPCAFYILAVWEGRVGLLEFTVVKSYVKDCLYSAEGVGRRMCLVVLFEAFCF